MENDEFDGPVESAGFHAGTVGGALLGLACLKHFVPELMDGNAMLTTAQTIAAIGIPTLSTVLGTAVGSVLGVLGQDYVDEHGVLEDLGEAITGVAFNKMPQAIGNTKGKVAEKLSQIATALDQKAHQIAEKFKNKPQQKNNGNDNIRSR